MAIAKAERLMNLALCLMNTKRPLSKRELRESIEAYREAWQHGSEDAFNRMFERDKDDLRELGLVIDVDENTLDGEIGYLARADRNRLPEIALDAEEAAALSLAARVWQQARLSGAASGALQKLRAAGVAFTEDGDAGRTALEPRIPAREAAFEPLLLAARDRRPVSFEYRKAGAAATEPRSVEPWALECWRGHWYLAGWDRDRAAVRVFRLSRITGRVRSRSGPFTTSVPEHVDVRAYVATFAGEGATATATVRLRRGPGSRCGPRRWRPVSWTGTGTSWRSRTATGSARTSPSSARTWSCWSPPTCALTCWTGCARWPASRAKHPKRPKELPGE